MLDTHEKVAIAAQASRNLAQAYGIREIESRLQQLLDGRVLGDAGLSTLEAEMAYRHSEVAVETARDRVREVEAAIRDREDEILAEVTEETTAVKKPGPDGTSIEELKPRFTNDSGRKTAATGRRKTDEEYKILKAAQAQAQQTFFELQGQAADAKARYNAATRQHSLLIAQMEATAAQLWMTASRISVLGGLDEAPATPASPALAAVR